MAPVPGSIGSVPNRLCVPLRFFRHASGHTIKCSVNTHPRGLEFEVRLDAKLLHSQVFSSPEELVRSAERGMGLLQARGWKAIATDVN